MQLQYAICIPFIRMDKSIDAVGDAIIFSRLGKNSGY